MDDEIKEKEGLQKQKMALMDEKHLLQSITDLTRTLNLDEHYTSTLTNLTSRIEIYKKFQEVDYQQAYQMQLMNFEFEKKYFQIFNDFINQKKTKNATIQPAKDAEKSRQGAQQKEVTTKNAVQNAQQIYSKAVNSEIVKNVG